ncbi:MAG: BadF/BadG/BcrA/BcrD ATPase family protein [Acidobacteriaceae bacterium]|nr:BadF/BadG/BcrA/BcrD ATPase family protein [Acidobacteriaceae bacterium]
MPYFLAVDVGGTKTDYLLADSNKPLATSRSGSLKRLRVSEETATQNLLEGLRSLEEQSGINLREVAATCVGSSGSSVPLVYDWLMKAFPQHVGGQLLVVEDVSIALDAAFFGGPGVLVLAGTGSNVAGRDSSGNISTAGGWGPVLADWGSGHRLGQTALEECFRDLDEGYVSLMLNEIQSFWGLSRLEELVEFANAQPGPDLSQLSTIVARCHHAGDRTAQRVIEKEASALAQTANIVLGRLSKAMRHETWVPQIAFAGSVMGQFQAMQDAVMQYIHQIHPEAIAIPEAVSPAEGALWRARKLHADAAAATAI